MTMMMVTLAQQGDGFLGGGIGTFVPIILLFGLFYFMMIRPQQRRDKERRKQIEEMTAGTRVLFGGGILGRIRERKDATFMVDVGAGVTIEIAQGAVNRVLREDEKASVDEK